MVLTENIITKLRQACKQINESQSLLEENVKVHLVRNIFLADMGYDTSISNCIFEQKKVNTYADIVLKINNEVALIIETKSYNHVISDLDIIQLANYVRNRGVEYGILTNGKEYLLINTNIRTSDNYSNDMLKQQIVFWFNIFNTKSIKYTHHDFFKFLSYESLFETKTTNYFRDIAQYKALKFLENDNSWRTYKSTLYRFFEYYAEVRKVYRPRILEDISIFDFENFINYKRELSKKCNPNRELVSDNGIRNNYSHISSMLNALTESQYGGINKTNFDKGREQNLTNIIKGTSIKTYQPIDNETFTQAVSFYLNKDKGIRDLAILLFCCCYGMERPKIQELKWSDFIYKNKENKFTEINIEGRILPVNLLLSSCLKNIKNEQEKAKLKTEFIFMVLYKGNYKKISTAVINKVFKQLNEISDDKKWNDFYPQFARNSLIVKLFEYGFTVDSIMYITGLPIENVSNYIKTENIIDRYSKQKFTSLTSLTKIFGNILDTTIAF